MKGGGKFEIILVVIALLITVGCIIGDYTEIKNEIPDDEKIFDEIKYDIEKVGRVSWMMSHYELVVANVENFEKSASNGTVRMKLLGKYFEVELQNAPSPSNPKFPHEKSCRGKIVGIPNSSASFTVTKNAITGYIDTKSEYYSIERTDQEYERKVVQVIYSSKARKDYNRIKEIDYAPKIMIDLRPKYLEGKLNLTVITKNTTVLKNENFDIHLILTNTGEKTINVWEMAEQISYDIYFYDSNDTKVSYSGGVIMRVPLTNENLVTLRPEQSINATFNSKYWNLKKGKYTLNAVYHTSKGESITKPYWVGKVQSNNVTIIVQ